ncbi:hypothetical protein QUF79_08730 [Fictibacillus enclensis]|nr:hypothetical protein [Fictibacillus enclensis]
MRKFQQSNFTLRRELDFYSQGIYTKPLNRYSLSTMHGKNEINRTLEAYDYALYKMS